MSVGMRIASGYGVAFLLVTALTLVGVATFLAIRHDVGGFSATSEITGKAADLGLAFSHLEVAVREHLSRSDDVSLIEARNAHDALATAVAAAANDHEPLGDRAVVTDAAHRLEAYWNGFEKVVSLRTERGQLLYDKIPANVRAVRDRFDQYKEAGYDAAALASDMAVAVTQLQDHMIRFAERRDAADGKTARAILANAHRRLGEMNRYLWVPGIKQIQEELVTLFGELDGEIGRIEQLLDAEDETKANSLTPNASAFADLADALRHRGEVEARDLRGALASGVERILIVALVVSAALLILGAAVLWLTQRSVARPIAALARSVNDLAQGKTGVTVPTVRHSDELARLAEAVGALDAAARESDDLRRRAEVMHDQLLTEKNRLERDGNAKTAFLVNMGHLFHRPLADIGHQAEGLMATLHRLGHSDLADDAERLQWTSERLTELIETILDYAKIEAGVISYEPGEVDLARLTAEVRERAAETADLHGNRLTALAAPGSGRITTDFEKLRQILLNLVDNACRFTTNGEVTLTVERQDEIVRFKIADTGPGIPSGQFDRLAQPFIRGAGKVGGAGLGLTIATHYCRLLGGRIDASTTPGRGCVVTVDLPLSTPLTPAVTVADPPKLAAAAPAID